MRFENRLEEIARYLDYLCGRWQDEHEFEDWKEYVDAMRAMVEKHSMTFVSLTKKPFKCTARQGNFIHSFRIKGKQIEYVTVEEMNNA